MCLCQRKMKKVSIFQELNILQPSSLATVFETNSLHGFPLILALQGPSRDVRDICDARGSVLKAKRTFPSCVSHQRGLLLACLSARAELQNLKGYDLGNPGLKNHLWLHQEDLFHPEDHRSVKDLDKKGGSTLWSISYVTYRERPLGFECQNPSGTYHSINVVFLVLGCPRSSLRFFCNRLWKNTNDFLANTMDYKESWVLNWCFWTVVLEKTLERVGQQEDPTSPS